MPWKYVASLAELDQKPALFKDRPKQIAVFKVDGQVFAVDNRCPHEGYSLAAGIVDANGLLTCNWHNWKFRLTDGRCVLGGDNVRTYPIRVEEGQVWVNTDDPPPKAVEAAILDGLKTAFDDQDFGRICREIARLHFHGRDPLTAVRRAVEWSHDRLEFGYGHAWAASADWIFWHRKFESEETASPPDARGDWDRQLVCLAEAIDAMAFDALRHPPYPYAEAGEPFSPEGFVSAVESEDRPKAEGMAARAVADSRHWPDLERAFAEAALAHYNDFGHSLIYVVKTRQLLELVGEEVERPLLLGLVRHLCYTTREDLIPEFQDYAVALDRLPDPVLPGEPNGSAVRGIEAPFPMSLREAFGWLAEHLERFPADVIYDALLEGLARNLLHFDARFGSAADRPVSDNVGWLDFTHGITFANAVRTICNRYPELWKPGLLQMACFLGRNRSYLDLDVEESPWLVDDAPAFFAVVEERVLDHGLRIPIFPAHLLKTTVAVQQELPHASASCRTFLLAGLNRFLNSPLKQKHTRRLARQAIDLVQRDFA